MAKFINNFFRGNKAKKDNVINLIEKSKKDKEQSQNKANEGLEDKTKLTNAKLSLDPVSEATASDFQKDLIKEEIEKFPPLTFGGVDIRTAYIFDDGDRYEASVYIRSALSRPITFEKTLLHIIDKDNNIVGSQLIDLREMGEIPPRSVRPWKVYFDKANVKIETLKKDEYRVAFDSRTNAEKVIKVEFESLPENLSYEEKQKYEDFLNNLPPIKPGQVSVSSYSLKKDRENNVTLVVLFRNGMNKDIKVQKLPIRISDKEGNKLIEAKFDLENEGIEIGSAKARLHRFIFPAGTISLENVNLKECTVDFM